MFFRFMMFSARFEHSNPFIEATNQKNTVSLCTSDRQIRCFSLVGLRSGLAKSEVPGHVKLTHPGIFAGLAFGPEDLSSTSRRQNKAYEPIKHIFNVFGSGGPPLPSQI